MQATYVIKVQLLEIYNEQLRDLLDDRNRGKKLDIRSTERSGLNVPDAIQVVQVSPSSPKKCLVSLHTVHEGLPLVKFC
jgi:hypothetical protein